MMTVRTMITALFVALFGFMFLSSDMANSLGIGHYRIYLFSATVAALAGLSLMMEPVLHRAFKRDAAILTGLAVLIIMTQLGSPIDAIDFKFLLPVMIMMAAPNIAARLTHLQVPTLVWGMLTLFILVASIPLLMGDTAAATKGYDDYRRYDSTGSIITLSSMASMVFLLSPSIARQSDARLRWMIFALGGWALLLVFLSATRTSLLMLALSWLLLTIVSPDHQRMIKFGFAALVSVIMLFGIYTATVSNAFLLRLTGSGTATDYSSGRFHSIEHWLAYAGENPLGQGIGFVRQMMSNERPMLDNGLLLEWPHNELIRFAVDGGILGLIFIIYLIGCLTVIGLKAARRSGDPATRVLITAIIADIITQSLLQNFFNSIYHATVAISILLVVCVQSSYPAAQRRPTATPHPRAQQRLGVQR